jgi:hypothetical protein
MGYPIWKEIIMKLTKKQLRKLIKEEMGNLPPAVVGVTDIDSGARHEVVVESGVDRNNEPTVKLRFGQSFTVEMTLDDWLGLNATVDEALR